MVQQTKNIRENAIQLGFNIDQTGKKLNKANRNVWKQYIDNRKRQRPFINDIQDTKYEIRPLQLGKFIETSNYENVKFQSGERAYRFSSNNRLMNFRNFIEFQAQIIKIFDDLVRNLIRLNSLSLTDTIVISIESPDLNKPFYMRIFVSNFTATSILDRLRQILQSFENFELNTTTFILRYIRNRQGGSYSSNFSKQDIYSKNSVVKQVYNTDEKIEDCFFQCLVLGISELKLLYDNNYGNKINFKLLIDTKNESSKRRSQELRENLARVKILILN